MRGLLQSILRGLARQVLKRYRPKIVGITGSLGKSTTKEAIALVLNLKYRIRASYKNYNNEIGLPLTVLGIKKSPGRSLWGWIGVFSKSIWLLAGPKRYYPEILVLEMGADKPGDIKYLTDFAPPTVAVLTGIGRAHLAAFQNLEAVAKEKKMIFKNLPPDGCAIVNFDDAKAMAGLKTEARLISYGLSEGAEIQAINIDWLLDETSGWPTGVGFKVCFDGNIVPMALNNVVAPHLVPATLAALAAGMYFNVNLVEAAAALRRFIALPGRMRLIPGIKKTLLVDDTYNANPESTLAALRAVARIKLAGTAERIAVLGDMLELGPATEEAHYQVGAVVAELGFNLLVTVGEASQKYTAPAARAAGMGERDVVSFANSAAAGLYLQDVLESGDAVLVKGSQGTRMERVVKEVMAEPLRAPELLVRQDKEWKGK